VIVFKRLVRVEEVGNIKQRWRQPYVKEDRGILEERERAEAR
jgi:hypothetical protein